MTEYDIHRPSFSATTKNDWEFPTEVDFDTDDLSEIADHFLLSASGFDDPGAFDDLALPVVSSRGHLSLNGLWAARHGPYSVERMPDIDAETKAEVEALIDGLGNEHFPAFEDVTVTDAEWADATGGEPSNPLGGVVNSVISPSQPSYSPQGATIGLVFLAAAAAVVTGFLGYGREKGDEREE